MNKDKKHEWLPWYRRADYKGDLTEEYKRILDSFRTKEKHPAACSDDVPPEVQNYINRIEFDAYELKQDAAVGDAFHRSAWLLLIMYLEYAEYSFGWTHSYITYALCVTGIVAVWWWYVREWERNSEALFPKLEGAPLPTDEGIKFEWELERIYQLRKEEQKEMEEQI